MIQALSMADDSKRSSHSAISCRPRDGFKKDSVYIADLIFENCFTSVYLLFPY